ncbi:MAG: succinate dehydrogenase cytochrome b subunit [Deltaproteobacteria bacterium]|nr:succinate dehydrogenase cytochrome b subunit [Deltaproteobacteria bacterium]
MSPIKALSSKIGQKILVAITALGLVFFSIIHLAGNLLLYVGKDAYNTYAHTLHSNPRLLLVVEIGLLITFALHIIIAINLSRQNRQARKNKYAVQASKQGRTPITPSLWMPFSGIIILGFLLLHVSEFTFKLRHPTEGMEPFARTWFILKDPISAIVYMIGSLFVGFHLWHGFQSIFQSLGLRHRSFTPIIEKIGMALAVFLALGFVSFPFWGLLKNLGVLN